MKIISMSIDVTKLDKSRFYQGKKGTYANLTLKLKDEVDEYGNHGFIAEQDTKEERDAGQRGTIVGNAKIVWEGESQPAAPQPPATNEFEEDSIPF